MFDGHCRKLGGFVFRVGHRPFGLREEVKNMRKALDTGMRWLRWLLRPNPRRFLAVWYTVWLVLGLKAFVVNWLIRHQPIRIAWVPVTGPAETVYLLAEIGVVSAIVAQAWRFDRANFGLAFLYEWYSLIEIGLSLLNPALWTYAMNQMWCTPWVFFGKTLYPPCQASFVWNDAMTTLISHVGFVAFYAFLHHGVPLLMLYQVRASLPRLAPLNPAVL